MVDAGTHGDLSTEPTEAPSETELVIGLVGALGTDLTGVASKIEARLRAVFGYKTETVPVSGLMAELSWDRDLSPAHEDERIKVNMDAGRDLNDAWSPRFSGRHDALARLAVLKIDAIRQSHNTLTNKDAAMPLDRFAYIFRSFKRPDEIRLLRAIYGDRFVLFGAFAPRARRRQHLYEGVWPTYGLEEESAWHSEHELKLDTLMSRDEREYGEGGQNVRDTFHRADFFVDDHPDRVGDQVERSLRLLFGDPFITPTKDETGVAHATTAALRSAEPGRQVGAALLNERGDLLTVGCNEVPRAFGGQYWPDDEDVAVDISKDGREFHNDWDTNNVQQQKIADDILASQRELGGAVATAATEFAVAAKYEIDRDVLDPLLDELAGAVKGLTDDTAKSAMLATKLGDITEFGRAVHAEMAAICTAARLGFALQDAVLYTTTFPCHNCARHVIATGIRRLVYIAPYAKSQAYLLHADSLVVAPDQATNDPTLSKVVFQPFVGIAPSRGSYLFDAPKRKHDDGRIMRCVPTAATPRLRDVESDELGIDQLGYHVRETTVVFRTREELKNTDPKIIEEAQ
jgi:deoxycytidylate deaminase